MWNMNIKGTIQEMYNKCLKIPADKLNNYMIKMKIKSLEVENNGYEVTLELLTYVGKYIILDGEVLDKYTFEYVRDATDAELELFYNIRLNELKIKNLEEKISR